MPPHLPPLLAVHLLRFPPERPGSAADCWQARFERVPLLLLWRAEAYAGAWAS